MQENFREEVIQLQLLLEMQNLLIFMLLLNKAKLKLMQKPGEQKVISPYQKVRLMKKHITYLFICKVKRKYLQIYHQSISLQLAMKIQKIILLLLGEPDREFDIPI